MQAIVELNNLYLNPLLFCFVLWRIISERLYLICLVHWVCSVVILVETGSHSVATEGLEYHVTKTILKYVDVWQASLSARVPSMNLHSRLQLSFWFKEINWELERCLSSENIILLLETGAELGQLIWMVSTLSLQRYFLIDLVIEHYDMNPCWEISTGSWLSFSQLP